MKKVLIANRGEIAVRIIRACHQAKLLTVAIYSTEDESSHHVSLADESICVGSHVMSDSYLNMERIISAAIISGADAIHPGYGFLSENAEFAALCEKCNIEFIGPSSKTISMMGDKATAREMAIKSGVPVVPGSKEILKDLNHLNLEVKKMGYPILIKASAGGGGRGMRIVHEESELENAFNMCKSEAKSAFGDDRVYVEKFIIAPKHVEVQIIADKHGKVLTVGERDCSMQRRNQKLIEETPCATLSEETRKKLYEVSKKLVKDIKYVNAGTIEYIVDKDENFYFIEMNTRIQVEHPISEEVSGIDLVYWQLEIARGEKLPYTQKSVNLTGHAIECRVTCEDAENNFMPSPGKVEILNIPGGMGVRVDTFIYQGYNVSKYYDSMLLKVIVHGVSRDDAISKMKQALCELVISPLKTNTEFLHKVLESNEFISGDYNTSTLEKMMGDM